MTDSELMAYAIDFRAAIIGDGPSAWMCGAISAPLCSAMSNMGITATLEESDLGECNHIFLRLQDSRVLDPTADQFNWCSKQQLPPVYLGSPTVIHENSTPYDGYCWNDLLKEFKRMEPAYKAINIGKMVRMVLATLPAGMIELPKI